MKKLLDLGILLLCWGVIKKMMILWKRVLVPFLNQTPPRKLVSYCYGGVPGPSILLRKTFKLKETDSSLVRRENYVINITPYQFSVRDFIVFPGEKKGEKKALPESRQTFEVAAARTFGLVNLVLPCQTSFFFWSASIRLFINQWSKLSPLYQAHGFKAGFETGPTCSACSAKIILDTDTVMQFYSRCFLHFAKYFEHQFWPGGMGIWSTEFFK